MHVSKLFSGIVLGKQELALFDLVAGRLLPVCYFQILCSKYNYNIFGCVPFPITAVRLAQFPDRKVEFDSCPSHRRRRPGSRTRSPVRAYQDFKSMLGQFQ